jgi:hypothetical protein
LADLPEIAGAFDSIGAFSGGVEGGDEDGDEQCDNADDDEEFYEGEGTTVGLAIHVWCPYLQFLQPGATEMSMIFKSCQI